MWQNNVQQQVYISTHPIILLLHNTHTIENPSILSQLELETPLSFLSSYSPVYIRITLGGGDAGPASQPQNSISVLNLQIQIHRLAISFQKPRLGEIRITAGEAPIHHNR